MDTTLTLPWEYFTEDKHRWAAIQLLHNPQRVSAF
jgi:hypothetical protein